MRDYDLLLNGETIWKRKEVDLEIQERKHGHKLEEQPSA